MSILRAAEQARHLLFEAVVDGSLRWIACRRGGRSRCGGRGRGWVAAFGFPGRKPWRWRHFARRLGLGRGRVLHGVGLHRGRGPWCGLVRAFWCARLRGVRAAQCGFQPLRHLREVLVGVRRLRFFDGRCGRGSRRSRRRRRSRTRALGLAQAPEVAFTRGTRARCRLPQAAASDGARVRQPVRPADRLGAARAAVHAAPCAARAARAAAWAAWAAVRARDATASVLPPSAAAGADAARVPEAAVQALAPAATATCCPRSAAPRAARCRSAPRVVAAAALRAPERRRAGC